MKLKKRNGKEVDIWLEENAFQANVKIAKRDSILFVCSYCGKKASRRVSLWRDIGNVRNEDFICEQCHREKNQKEKYGVKNPMQRKEVAEKQKKSNFEKYGVENILSLKENKEKRRESQKQFKEEIQSKTKKTLKERYGVENAFLIYQPYEIEKRKKKTYEILSHFDNASIITPWEEYEGVRKSYDFRCNKCGAEFSAFAEHALLYNTIRCPVCEPFIRSKEEQKLIDTIRSHNIKAIGNERSVIPPLEIDVYIPNFHFGIEINGLYWHNESHKKTTYHLYKIQEAQKNKVKLFSFFEDELKYKKNIVYSMIFAQLGIFQQKLSARNTRISFVDFETKNTFLQENHLQGADEANIAIGLYYEEELISIMTFYSRENTFILSRFASKTHTLVRGAASKLLKHFMKKYNPSSIISFSDKRFSSGELYKKLGFSFYGTNPPAYWYVKNDKRFHRFNFRKERLKNRFPHFYNESKTEKEIMEAAGYKRIWDCGNDKWVLNLTKKHI